MCDRVLVITISSYDSKVQSTGTAVLLRSTVPTTVNNTHLLDAFRCNNFIRAFKDCHSRFVSITYVKIFELVFVNKMF